MGRNPTAVPAGQSTIDELEVLGHELGNVLHGMACMTGLLRDSGLDARQRRWLASVEQACGQMRRIIENMQRQRDGLAGAPAAGRLNGIRLLEDALAAQAPAAAGKGIELLLLAPSGLPGYWLGDACLLRQVLDNLLGNAVRYSASGRVLLEAAPDRRESGTLVIRVLDNGPGVEDTTGLFEPYRRGAAACSGPAGRGLGLFICRRITDSLGGRIGCRNRPSGGACFEVRIPGALQPGVRTLEPSPCLDRIDCRVDLEPDWMRSVGGLLDRLGVSWRSASDTDRGRRRAAALDLLIRPASDRPGEGGTGILIEAERPAKGAAVRLAAPVLESSLETALLRLLLESRVRAVSPRGARG